jgi:hypothetical protein
MSILFAAALFSMAGCGGGGSSTATQTPASDRYIVSGKIVGTDGLGLAGVTVQLAIGSYIVTTDANGNYSFNTTSNGTYPITISKVGFTFSPANQTVTVSGANVTGLNFTASSYSISGNVTSGGSPLAGVTVTLSGNGAQAGGSATTDSSGNYSLPVLTNFISGNYTLTPNKAGYVFTPPTQTVSINGTSITGKNFTTSLRFTDNGDGTIKDNNTGLTWLKNANCSDSAGGVSKSSGYLNWNDATSWSSKLASGLCGLTDNSVAGQWRLPTSNEWSGLIDVTKVNPSLPAGQPFTNVQSIIQSVNGYWSSSIETSTSAYFTTMYNGTKDYVDKTQNKFVWPVR